MPNPLTGDPWPWEPQPQQNTATRDNYVDAVAAAHKGRAGAPAATTTQGYLRYSFNDGSWVEIGPNGEIADQKIVQPTAAETSHIETVTNPDQTKTVYNVNPQTNTATQVQGLPSSAAPPRTAQEQLADAGVYISGNTVYAKDPSTGVWGPSDSTKAQQQLDNARTVAQTQLDAANTKKIEIQNAIDAATDPSQKAALANQAQQAEIDYKNALSQSQAVNNQIAVAKQALDDAVQRGDLQVKQGQLGVNQGQLAVNQASTASQIQSRTIQDQIAQAKSGPEIEQILANAGYTKAQAASVMSKIGEPTVWQTGTTQPNTTYWDPTTQSVKTIPNESYLPTDPGRMTIQLQQQMNQQQQALQQQVNLGKLTPDQAAGQFNQWYDQNIEPMKPTIASLQASQQAAVQSAQGAAQTALINPSLEVARLAETASNDAQSRLVSMLPYVTGANFNQALGKAMSGGWKNLSPQDVVGASTYSLPNLQEVGRQGAAAALAHLSPTAQAILNAPAGPAQAPVPGLPDVNQLLSRGAYNFGAPSPGAGVATGAVAGGGAPQVGRDPGFTAYNPAIAAAAARDPGISAYDPAIAAAAARDPGFTAYNPAGLINTTGQPGGAQVGGGTPVMPPGTTTTPYAGAPFSWQDLLARQQQDAQDQAAQAQAWPQYTPAQ